MDAVMLGIVAALLQAAGYLTYGWKVLKRDVSPNAVSWLMFAYGTTLLLVVEWDRDAGLALLFLPAVCALSSIVVAFYALQRASVWWPEHILERFSFALDVSLTVAYLSAWMFLANNLITDRSKDIAEIVILVCWNIGIFTSFFPLLRQVYYHPASEHFTPWAVWALAYLALSAATIIEDGIFTELLLYPLIQAIIHGFIAIHTGYWRYRHKLSVV